MKTVQVARRNLQSILQGLPMRIVAWKLMQEGVWHDVYLLVDKNQDRYIVKLPKKALEEWEKKQKRERWLLERIQSKAAQFFPRVVYTDCSKKIVPFSFQILTYIEGAQVARNQTMIQALAYMLKELHRHRYPKWGGLPPRRALFSFDRYFSYRFSAQIGRLPKTIQKKLRPTLTQIRMALRKCKCRQKFSLTHGDANTRNLLQDKMGRLKLIDWEMADICPPSRDLADLFVIEGFSEKEKQYFLGRYGDVSEAMRCEISVFESLAHFAELLDDLESGKNVLAAIQEDVLEPLRVVMGRN